VSSLKPLALGVVADLRARRLLPVAILLLAALIAVPLLLSRSPEPVTVDAAPSADVVDTGGLPGPDEALGGKPLVTLASLEVSSDLDSFRPRDPFKPLRTLDAIGADPVTNVALAPTGTGAGDPAGGSGSQPSGAGDTGGANPSPGGGGNGGGRGGPAPTPAPAPTPGPAPDPEPAPERRYTYAVDLTFDGPESDLRTFRNLPRLSMLPSEASPLLIFLGVGADANDVVFLVDATLRPSSEGEGTCSPSPKDCATVSLEPGEQQVFLDDQNRRYVLQVDQIKEVPLIDAAQAFDQREAGSATAGTGKPVRRLLLQPLSELTVIGGQQ